MNCLICGYGELKLGETRVLCHHPKFTYTKVVTSKNDCPLESCKTVEDYKRKIETLTD